MTFPNDRAQSSRKKHQRRRFRCGYWIHHRHVVKSHISSWVDILFDKRDRVGTSACHTVGIERVSLGGATRQRVQHVSIELSLKDLGRITIRAEIEAERQRRARCIAECLRNRGWVS